MINHRSPDTDAQREHLRESIKFLDRAKGFARALVNSGEKPDTAPPSSRRRASAECGRAPSDQPESPEPRLSALDAGVEKQRARSHSAAQKKVDADDSPKKFDSEFDRKFVRCEEIGRGASGVVFVVKPRDAADSTTCAPSKKFACKEILLGSSPEQENDRDKSREILAAMKELRLLKGLRHPNLVELHDYFIEGDTCRMVMSLHSGGDLKASLDARGCLAEEDVRGIMTGVLRGLEHMHSKGVVHRDLKLENIVLLDEFSIADVKIIDFGLAKQLAAITSNSIQQHTICGSPMYMAPEVATPLIEVDNRVLSAYGIEADIWSCGIVMFLLLSGYPPFDAHSGLYQLFKQIRSGKLAMSDPIWELISDGAKDMMGTLLHLDPKRRPTASEALKHPWLQE